MFELTFSRIKKRVDTSYATASLRSKLLVLTKIPCITLLALVFSEKCRVIKNRIIQSEVIYSETTRASIACRNKAMSCERYVKVTGKNVVLIFNKINFCFHIIKKGEQKVLHCIVIGQIYAIEICLHMQST